MTQKPNPSMIILAREARGITQKDLAATIGINQGTLSKLEGGMGEITVEHLNKLSETLNYPVAFFLQQGHVYPLGQNYYRKNKSVPKKVLTRINAEINIRRIHIQNLLRSVDVGTDKIRHLEIDGEHYKSASDIASAIREFWNLPHGPIDNMTRVLEDAGILVVHCTFGTNKFSGVRVVTEDGHFAVFVNADMPGDRLRFTLAHELGHIIMHMLPSEKMEDEAHEFASEFLMPADQVRSQLYTLNFEKLGFLKRFWKVSISSLVVRARDLGTISKRHADHLWINIGKRGYRREEPAELAIPQEKPSLLKEVIDVHLAELGYAEEELIDTLCMPHWEFNEWYAEPKKGLQLLKVR